MNTIARNAKRRCTSESNTGVAVARAPEAGQDVDQHCRGVHHAEQEQVADREHAHQELAVAAKHGDEHEPLQCITASVSAAAMKLQHLFLARIGQRGAVRAGIWHFTVVQGSRKAAPTRKPRV